MGVTSEVPTADASGEDERGDGGALMDNHSAGEILAAEVLDPPAGAPDPVADRAVDHDGPDEDEPHVCAEPNAFDHSARDDGRRDDCKRHLEGHEQERRNGRAWPELPLHVPEHGAAEVADEPVFLPAEGQREDDDDPGQGRDAHRDDAHHHCVHHVLAAHEAPVEEGQPWRHQQDQRSADHHPSGVAGAQALDRHGKPADSSRREGGEG
mmetsp:Transcript_92351/g.180922  ORF Transcript_92351/g.180922 Transcript_92351/m.180922 type:complete len:210 (+) Transcript_92351:169-798(+)